MRNKVLYMSRPASINHAESVAVKMEENVTNFSGAVERLRQYREKQTRCSKEIVALWCNFISDHTGSKGPDEWLINEQVFIASLDIGLYSVAKECYENLHQQFPGSLRLKRLRGMYMESLENWEEAQAIYDNILEADPVDAGAHKRQSAILKAQNRIPEAVKKLNDYIEVNCMDFEAWMELCDLYLSQLDYEKAAFCMEELILNNPNNHLYHQRYAEIKYSQGDFEMARSYYTQAHRLSSNNIRALYGIVLCCQKLAAGKGKTKAENIAYAQSAIKILDTKFKEANSSTREIHAKAIKSLLDCISQ